MSPTAALYPDVHDLPEQPWRPLTQRDVEILEDGGFHSIAKITQRYVNGAKRSSWLFGRLACLHGRHDWQSPEDVSGGELYRCARCPRKLLVQTNA